MRYACCRVALLAGVAFPVLDGCGSASHESPTAAAPPTTMTMTTMTAAVAPMTRPTVAAPSASAVPSVPPVIRSAPASIDAILAGTKTSTARKGKRAYAVGPAVTTDGRRRVDVEITAVEPKRLANLTAADAASYGSTSLAAYWAALTHSYPGLTDDDIVTVVHFRLADPK